MARHRTVSTARMQRVACAAAFALAVLLSKGAAADQLAAISQAPLFGTAEIHSSNLKMFPKWRGMLQLFEKQRKTCSPDQCMKKQWDAVIARLRGLDLMA